MFRDFKLITLAVLLVVLLIVGIPLLYTRNEGTPTEAEFDAEFRLTFNNLTFGYIVPDSLAVSELDPLCRRFPHDSNPSCAKFVNTLRKLDADLATALQQLEDVLESPPPGTSQELLNRANDFLERFMLAHQANGLLLDGWDSADESKWVRGWELRDQSNEKKLSLDQSRP